jgi:PHD/YefM family antitoxin component YafN of YafNO toxin-antitoxin module
MPNKPNMETRSVEELVENALALVKQVGASKQPIQITAKGQQPVILIDRETYDDQLHLIELACQLMKGMVDIGAGRTKPLEEFIDEFADAKGIRS